MLTHPTHDRLVALGLTGMAKALEEQRKQPDVAVGLILRRPVNAPAGLLCGFGPHVLPPRRSKRGEFSVGLPAMSAHDALVYPRDSAIILQRA
jgi:hypothetical protein